jgi:hypothetical protein
MMPIRAVVSGSFHRHMSQVQEAVEELRACGVVVLSPSDPRIVDSAGAFLFVASDRHRSVRLVQDRHLACMSQSHFLWLVCPDGYVGQSASMEVGFAIGQRIPVYGTVLPNDVTLRQYVRIVDGIREAVRLAEEGVQSKIARPTLLVDPMEAVEEVYAEMETLRSLLRTPSKDDVAKEVSPIQERICSIITPTTSR